ncbi:unnamed protein product [Eretmochelys imbricata]
MGGQDYTKEGQTPLSVPLPIAFSAPEKTKEAAVGLWRRRPDLKGLLREIAGGTWPNNFALTLIEYVKLGTPGRRAASSPSPGLSRSQAVGVQRVAVLQPKTGLHPQASRAAEGTLPGREELGSLPLGKCSLDTGASGVTGEQSQGPQQVRYVRHRGQTRTS